MSAAGLEQIERDYLQQLYDHTNGDASVQVSMYAIGEAIDMDRDTSSQVAQTLIGLNYAEIKTLSGGVCISADGIAAIDGAGGGNAGSSVGDSQGLSNSRVLSQTDLEAVNRASEFMKRQAGVLSLDFDGLTELVADLRTIDAQLSSSRPKTEVVRACFKSIEAIMDALGHKEACSRLRVLIGE